MKINRRKTRQQIHKLEKRRKEILQKKFNIEKAILDLGQSDPRIVQLAMAQKRYDEQRRLNADLLSAHRSLDSYADLYAGQDATQKVWLHAKIRFDKSFLERMDKGPESAIVQTLALQIARNLCEKVKELENVFGRVNVPNNPDPSSQIFPND